ncbi:MAG: ATP-binding cassette domain-containing protein [Planctomycetota bacterium]
MQTPENPGPAIEATGLFKTFHSRERGVVNAVQGLDLTCHYGEIFGLLGPNGAGKTTTLRMLAGILVPSAGVARIAGVDAGIDPIAVRQRIGFLSGSTGLYPRLTAVETLRYFGKLHGLQGAALEQRIEELVATFRLHEFASGRCEGLSTGQRQRVSIARAVVHDPDVLILDEPTTGLDILAASDMIDFIESRRSAGRCVLFSTHILSEAERLCDRIGIVYHGRTLAAGTLDELRAESGAQFLEQIFKVFVERASLAPNA